MVRETRHLWVGNLPENIREDRIREHFKRYGRVQNVKLLGRTESPGASASAGASGICATVAFMDIKSASKAHNAEHVVDECTLTTEYYEPAAIPSAAGAPSAGSSPAGSGYSGSSSSMNSALTPAPATVSRYHLSGGEEGSGTCAIAATAAAPANWRGTNDSATDYCRRGNTPAAYSRYQRNNSNAPYSTPPSNVDRTTPHHRWYSNGERSGGGGGATGGSSTPSTPGGGTEPGLRRRRSGSGSSRSDSSSPEPSDASRASTPSAPPPAAPLVPAAAVPPDDHAARTPPNHHHQWSSTVNGRPLAICVRNLPTRSTDSSLKDGLYHEYKKHGKVVWVKIVGQNADRYAVVRFKKPSDVEKALEVSQDKLFFGCKISVAPHQSCDEDAETAKPYETDIDEYHPKATRTLFIGNLEKDVTQQQLRDKFKHFGRIIEIDIKKGSSGGAGYAFCQYATISSVVEAIRAMDGEYVGGSRVKLGFGKPVATTCVWVDGLTEHTEKQVLSAVSRCGAATSVCVDRAAGAALVHFEQAGAAGGAVRELRRLAALASAAEPDRPRLAVDYASRECQEAFYEQLEKHGGAAALTSSERLGSDLTPRYMQSSRHESIRYDSCGSRSRASSYGRSSSRTPRYSTLEHYDPTEYAADRRYRVYEELGSSPQPEDTPYDDRLQSVVVSPHRSRRHRRDSSPEDRKHSKDRHRSSTTITVSTIRRSRSGSRGSRHAARRRHRRRRDGSGSRAGTPLRDEPDAPPSEPRRPPRERPPLPMSLPLPKFAAQLLRAAGVPARAAAAAAPAPASPSRPRSASSSSAGSAPHSPSLEERIRSLDEKYEKWSGSRALPEPPAPDRARLRHRLLDVDIHEVKPSEVVRSLLAKRSVFDEDSERLEGAVRAPSPSGSPRGRPCVPRSLRYPFPTHQSPQTPSTPLTPLTPQTPSLLLSTTYPPLPESDADVTDRPSDPRLNRIEKPFHLEKLGKFNENDYKIDSRIRLRTPSTEKPLDVNERRHSPKSDRELQDPRKELERRRRNSVLSARESETKTSFDVEEKEIKEAIEKIDPEFSKEKSSLMTSDSSQVEESLDSCDDKSSVLATISSSDEKSEENKLCRTDLPSTPNDNNLHKTELVLQDKQPEYLNVDLQTENTQKPKSPKSSDLTKSNERLDLILPLKGDNDKCKDILNQNHINKDIGMELEIHLSQIRQNKEICELGQELLKSQDKNGKDRFNQNIILEVFHTKLEKENIEFDKSIDKDNKTNIEKKIIENDKNVEERSKNDRDKIRNYKDRLEKERHDHERDKLKSNKNDRGFEKSCERAFLERSDKYKAEKDIDKIHKEKNEREIERSKNTDDKAAHDHKKDKTEKDRRKYNNEVETSKTKKEDKHKQDRKKDDSKRDSKTNSETSKSRKSSRDESTKDISRKDSTDSSASRASQDSCKSKDLEHIEIKEEPNHQKPKAKYYSDLFFKHNSEKEQLLKAIEFKSESVVKVKTEIKEEKEQIVKIKTEHLPDTVKCKVEHVEKQRHYSLDSPSIECKRKERLDSSSSLPSSIGHKRRMSSQDSLESLTEEVKKSKNETKGFERRDSKDSRNFDRHKTTKFNKGHFAKLIENKTKEDKKNLVKLPDDSVVESKDIDAKEPKRLIKKSPKSDNEDRMVTNSETRADGLRNDLDFLATLELRSSEEDEKQKALRKEMKEKKRIQQLQQIQELQMQQDALQQAELIGKYKDDKKQKSDEKKKEVAREKRMSTDRKSKDEKPENSKRKNRKHLQSTDSSDSDEPKKHSIFDIVDDGPTYISMYDKVKARSCKNMQKQEEEKRQEKIKAKFSQLKQSRAKREEKKRSSWDEDSDSDHDRRKSQKTSINSSSDDEHIVISKKREKSHGSSLDYDLKSNEYFSIASTEEDTRNKLSRKNMRTRIISDTSDDDLSKRSLSKSPSFLNELRKEIMANIDSLQRIKSEETSHIETTDKIRKNSLLTLFGKSDSDDSKIKSSSESNDIKPGYVKTLCNDLSSGSESASSRPVGQIRKRHKKKQKKHKFSFTDEEFKAENSELDNESKHKNSEKIRRHSTKKEKRKDKTRESIDTDDHYDKSKSKKEKRPSHNSMDTDSVSNTVKKDGKMEDIFGPLSDESDKDVGTHKVNISTLDYDPNDADQINSEEPKAKEKEELKRKKDKRKKEKRYLLKEDDNSLDVDAVSKAIEARLFADTVIDEDSRSKLDCVIKTTDHPLNNDMNAVKLSDKHIDRAKRESKEKKKKKKKNKEDRQSRKDHHHSHSEKVNKSDYCDRDIMELSPKLLDIPLPADIQKVGDSDKFNLESPSLPRLTDSPPNVRSPEHEDIKSKASDILSHHSADLMDIDFVTHQTIEINDIPMPPPYENIVKDISEVPLPEDPAPPNMDHNKSEVFFARDVDVSENAVRSICKIDQEPDKTVDQIDNSSKVDKKVVEKPRAIISQKETADAVAALLGESFGGKEDTFVNCYEEVETDINNEIEVETNTNEPEIIPEEDAEEMRQAVQNLNASEMEMKPDTPVSDNDLLLIDTDTEEADEIHQDSNEKLPENLKPSNQSPTDSKTELSKSVSPKKILEPSVTSVTKEVNVKQNETDIKIQLPKRVVPSQITSSPTPVITSWTLTNNKIIEPHVNISNNQIINRDNNEIKPTHITANIVQIKTSQNQHVTASVRPIITPNRAVSAPYQVINHMIRPHTSNMQPPTIKIPEPHIVYQKPAGIVISPRMTNDTRLQSPKSSPQSEGMTSPRLANMSILSTSPQNLNSVGIASQNVMSQRSPGQVTVVRMQQPPLSPIQAMHLPPGARAMISPNRPNSVLVQTQGAPLHFNRLPVTPVLAPIGKQINVNNIVQQNKSLNLNAPLLHQQKVIGTDCRKNDQRIENVNENSKIILSPTSLQHSTNPTVMAQNRLISMQNALHAGNSNIHVSNKVMVNNISEKRETPAQKAELNHTPFVSAPMIHVSGVHHTTSSIIQTSKSVTLQDHQNPNRSSNSHVIHTLNSQRLLTTAPISNIIQLESNKSPSVLSMATIRSPAVLTKIETCNSAVATTTSLSNVVMTPLLLKTSSVPTTIRLNPKKDSLITHLPKSSEKSEISVISQSASNISEINKKDEHIKNLSIDHNIAKCETDFEELLKDNTNEIKVTIDPEKKLEINVGKTVTLITQNILKQDSIETLVDDISNQKPSSETEQGGEIIEKPANTHEKNSDKNEELEKSNSKSIIKDMENNKSINLESNLESVFNKIRHEDKSLNILLPVKSMPSTKQESPNGTENLKFRNMDENDSWNTQDINIESVIKKVDSLCNESVDNDNNGDSSSVATVELNTSSQSTNISDSTFMEEVNTKPSETGGDTVNNQDIFTGDLTLEKSTAASKRGGRGVRGKRSEKNQDRVQTRQISKTSRGGSSTKRGRGRAKVDKKIKNLVSLPSNNIPGDVYDFHEDSGDESGTSPNKNEPRPRLILTIKSPLSGQSNATSSLSITQKEQIKTAEKNCKEESEDSTPSPSLNTRKSRRLQEKDVQKNTTDEDDIVKVINPKGGKDTNKKRQTRQTGGKTIQTEKSLGNDTRKSPRGAKRTRDRSISDASVDSCDEKSVKLDAPKEPKIPKTVEPPVASKLEPDPSQRAKTTTNIQPSTINPPVVTQPVQPVAPTPIMKPPKKMISEISAKLASVFEAAAAAGPVRQQTAVERTPFEADKQVSMLRNPELATAAPTTEIMTAATGDVRMKPSSEVLIASAGAGGSEAGVPRVHSPALPHRLADRAAPLLHRSGEGESARLGSVAGAAGAAGAAGGAGLARTPRGYPGASLPRGAHHPHPPPQPAKQVAVVGPHHHHPHSGAASRVTITSVPNVSPQGQITLGEGMYPHFSHQHYQMYQQHFRATQHEARTTPSPYTRALEAEGCEAPTPPLELRRPPGARVPRPAHSPSPADRLIMFGAGMGRSPPPAHGTSRLAGALPPPPLPPSAAPAALPPALPPSLPSLPPAAPSGPPHASQVPREADSLQMLLRRYPVMWQGLLALKNDSAAVQMHFVGGNPAVAGDTLPRLTDGSTPPLRIAQRMRLEPLQLDQVHRKMKLENEHCILLALPCGRDHMDVLQQSTNLTSGFITYLQRKQAAGIVNVAPPGHHQAMYTVHIFPSCDFANSNLSRIAPDLMHRVADIAHLLIVIATATAGPL